MESIQFDKEAFLSFKLSAPRKVELPGGMVLHVKALTAGERDGLEFALLKNQGVNYRARWTAACACDAEGNTHFTPQDIPRIAAIGASFVDPIFKAAVEHNDLSERAVEGAVKN